MNDLSDKKPKRCTRRGDVLARREEILETATELFADQVSPTRSRRCLADRLQVGKGTIYRHFPSKRELFLAAADRVMRKLQEQVNANIAGIDDGLERIERAIATFLSFFAEHPSFVELLIQERAYFKDRKRPTYFEHREINIERWRQVYRDLIAEGRVRDMPVEQITNVVSNVLYGIMVTNFFNGQPKPSDVQAREILDVVFNGILSVPERAAPRQTGHPNRVARDIGKPRLIERILRRMSTAMNRRWWMVLIVPLWASAAATGCQQAQLGAAPLDSGGRL